MCAHCTVIFLILLLHGCGAYLTNCYLVILLTYGNIHTVLSAPCGWDPPMTHPLFNSANLSPSPPSRPVPRCVGGIEEVGAGRALGGGPRVSPPPPPPPPPPRPKGQANRLANLILACKQLQENQAVAWI
jgi:hypothetical protein